MASCGSLPAGHKGTNATGALDADWRLNLAKREALRSVAIAALADPRQQGSAPAAPLTQPLEAISDPLDKPLRYPALGRFGDRFLRYLTCNTRRFHDVSNFMFLVGNEFAILARLLWIV